MLSSDLIDLDTQVALRKAAPIVTGVPFDVAQKIAGVLAGVAEQEKPNQDPRGQDYWQTSLRKIHHLCDFSEEVLDARVGKACREMGLTCWRKGEGYQVAWSRAQLKILKRYFKV